ncbi:MAG TPA: FAD-binding protein, partial [Saprospiraceae bacterium]|nr:FAD-binding protein [Saprospiraceae bacterium]
MSVLIIIESTEGKLNKGAFEICTYGHKTAQVLGGDCNALILGHAENASDVGLYGVKNAYQISVPQLTANGLSVDKSVYSGKAIATYEIGSTQKIITVMGNTIQPEIIGAKISLSSIDIDIPSSTTKVVDRKTMSGTVPLPEAERVVSAGRGMKGPENWAIIEELAAELNATTACSRPVADAHW